MKNCEKEIRVTSKSAEETYNSPITEICKKSKWTTEALKLDPGNCRDEEIRKYFEDIIRRTKK